MKSKRILFIIIVITLLSFSGFTLFNSKIFPEEVTDQTVVHAKRITEPECVEPMWKMPEKTATIELSHPRIERGFRTIDGWIKIHDLQGFRQAIPELGSLSDFTSLILILNIDTPRVVRFPDRDTFLVHVVDPSLIAPDGSYQFPFQLIGRKPGEISLSLFWKWRLFTEGACSVAINGVYAGCWIGGELNKDCVCDTLGDMPAPGSWACWAHPLTFRAVWRSWGCAGQPPY